MLKNSTASEDDYKEDSQTCSPVAGSGARKEKASQGNHSDGDKTHLDIKMPGMLLKSVL